VIYDFNREEMFSGLVGEGAWLNGKAIRVGNVAEKSKAVLCTGFPVGTDFSESALEEFVRSIRSYKKVRLLGSAALSLAYVASGRTDVYAEKDIGIWDVAAGIAVVGSAGGKVRFSRSRKENRLLVMAGNKALLADEGGLGG
jgi:myo-inositol-1(or 4)-monophosphatase